MVDDTRRIGFPSGNWLAAKQQFERLVTADLDRNMMDPDLLREAR
jgi:hypothetical protein